MYISGGSNIYPREIEEKLLQHPAIGEVAMLGVPDPVWGEVGLAVCVLRPGAATDDAALAAWLEERMARYKMPKRFVFWEALPKSAYGKVPKKMIRAELEAARRTCSRGAPWLTSGARSSSQVPPRASGRTSRVFCCPAAMRCTFWIGIRISWQ